MRKLLFASFIAFAAFAANAAYLYWQVDDTAIDTYNATLSSPSDSAYAGSGVYFKLKDSNGNYYGGAVGDPGSTYGTSGAVEGGKAAIGGSYYSSGINEGFSYYVEMYNSDNWLIARSASINSSSGSDWTAGYADNIRTTDLSNIPSVQIWHAGGFVAVPEPTSAMLMLFGAAFLGLKRKNRRIA